MCALPLLAVLVVYAALSTLALAADVKNVLSGTNAFAKVDVIDATAGTGSTPTPQQLAPYDAVLVFADGDWADAATLGTNLADSSDTKGRVVVAVAANDATLRLQGRWKDDGYDLITPGGLSGPQVTAPLIVMEPGRPAGGRRDKLDSITRLSVNGCVSAWSCRGRAMGQRRAAHRARREERPPHGCHQHVPALQRSGAISLGHQHQRRCHHAQRAAVLAG